MWRHSRRKGNPLRLRDGLSLPILRFTVVVSLVASCAKEGSFRFNAPITVDSLPRLSSYRFRPRYTDGPDHPT